MSIQWDVMIALKELDDGGTPVRFQKYTGDAETYITFFEYNDQVEDHAEDNIDTIGHYVQVDVWSKGNYNATVNSVKRLMRQAGFMYSNGQDLYEPDTKIFHKGLRFFKPEYQDY